MKRLARVALVTALALFEVLMLALGLMAWNSPAAQFGWNVGTDGVTITNVEPNSGAAEAGVAVGDRIVYEKMPILGRIDALLNEGVYPGAAITFPIVHKGIERVVTVESKPFPNVAAAALVAYELATFSIGFVGLALVLLRPSRMTWGLAMVAPVLFIPEPVYLWAERAPPAQGLTIHLAISLAYAMQLTGLMLFASRFPTDRPKGVALVVDRLAVPCGAIAMAIYFYVNWAVYAASAPPPHWTLWLQDYGTTIFLCIATVIALVSNYAVAARADRSRLMPVIVSFALLMATTLVQQFVTQVSSNAAVDAFWNLAVAASVTLLATAIAYGVVKHRVIDVSFIVSRTLVYTVLTVSVVAIFALIEYLFGKLLERSSLATVIEIGAAVAIGVSLNYVHGWLDRSIDVVLFRRRHLAEKRMERASETLPHASSESFVNEMLVAEPVDALDLASAAVFRCNGGAFRREAAAGWSEAHAAELDENDHLVVRLRAELQPLALSGLRWPRLDLPNGVAQPLYAVPVASGHRLAAIALYGGHTGGEDLDPDERRSLRGLAAGAALAYDHLTAEALHKTVAELRGENDALRRSQDVLVERVLKHLE
ncbi:MAG: hypothetical protein JO175_04330 [Candidatus Eremiobacteraeota bacterium]|nr:hypothetical protein [Candidatus Eremiobacteraeota bacterium]